MFEMKQVQLPTRDVVSVSHIGNINIIGGQVIENILFVPEFKWNLLFVF